MAQITVYARAAGNWSSIEWDTVAGGGGTDYANPQNGGGNTFICNVNGFAVALDVDVAVDSIQATAAGGTIGVPNSTARIITVSNGGLTSSYNGTILTWGTGTSSLTINGNVTYSSTNTTTGMLPANSSQTVIVNGQVTNTSSGYAIYGVAATGGSVVVSNAGSTAISNTGGGMGVRMSSTGSASITGLVSLSGAGYGFYANGGGTYTLSGRVSHSGSSTGVAWLVTAGTTNWTPDATGVSAAISGATSAAAIAHSAGTFNILGSLNTTNASSGIGVGNAPAGPVRLTGGTLNWIAAATLSAGQECEIAVTGGTINLATASGALSLINRGMVSIQLKAGTLVTTASGNTASIINSANGNAVIHGGTAANRAIIKNRPPRIGSRVVGVA